jgi:hypothetical protein
MASALTVSVNPDFYGYTQARNVLNISSHGKSYLGFCRERTDDLSQEICSTVGNNVNMYSSISKSKFVRYSWS